MENLAPLEQDARVRLTDDQAHEFVIRTVTTQSESLLRTAHRHSLCADDAHDAFQRSMEIFLRRAPTLDPESAHKWLHVVVKHEAMEVRRGRIAALGYEDVDLERHASPHDASPEERVLGTDRARRATEALRRLKPQELRAMWLKALGHSYAEIGAATGFSQTKVNRSLAEGRKSFLERFEGIESGVECERWRPVLAAMAQGEASAEQITDARPHLRNCPACRAQLKALHRRPLAAILPVGLVSAVARLGGFVERVLPGGDASMTAASGTKLAALLATGAAATAGGGFVMAQEQEGAHHAPTSTESATVAHALAPTRAVASPPPATTSTRASASRASPRRRTAPKRRLIARHQPGGIEFMPGGAIAPPTTAPKRSPAPAPASRHALTPHQLPRRSGAPDTVRGEFSPQP